MKKTTSGICLKNLWFASRNGETIAAVVVGAVILALAVSSVAIMLSSNSTLETEYEKNNTVFLLQKNAEAVIRRVTTSWIGEGEVFYLRKDTSAKNYLVLTGSQNMDYRYINALGEWTNSGTSTDPVYTRSFLMEKKDPSVGNGGQVIRAAVKEMIRK